jgi:mono/diheme cytochrome c family protein
MLRQASRRFTAAGSVLFLWVGLSFGAAGPVPFPSRSDLPRKALEILQRHCASCHGSEEKAKGGFGHVLDRERLVTRGQVVPGKLAESALYERTARGEMPPGKKPKLSADELGILARWIETGAPAPLGSIDFTPVAEADVLRLIVADLNSLEARDRRFARYVSLAHLLPSGASPGDLEMHRQALAKLVNSLSWHPRLRIPHAIDPARTVFRVDLRWYRWTARNWERLVVRYPYRSLGGEPLREAARLTATESPLVRGDWFVATASQAAFYHDFLNLPGTDRALERQLQVDVRANLDEESAARSGFNGSGVARNNRVLERRDAPLGAYWRSYDFSENTGRQNLFDRPLGPLPGPHGFVQAGGEIIFHLPNGLLGFMLVDGAGGRVEKAPGDIVSDPKRPDRLVENGVSCLGCHSSGLIPKDDQVRRHVLGHPHAFPLGVRETVRALYPPPATFRALVDEDSQKFVAALKKLGVAAGDPEPVSTVVLRYEGVLDVRTAAAEVGCRPEELAARIRTDIELTRTLGPLLARGTVQRQVFEEAFPQLLRLSPGSGGVRETPVAGGPVFLRGHRGDVRALAWGPGGVAATAAADRTVRLWETNTGRERLILEAGTDEIEALAFSPAGKQIAWAGHDRVIRVWEAGSKRTRRLVGHTDAVKALVFSSDGRRLFSAGADRVVRIWDVERGEERDSLVGHTGTINVLALSPDGLRLLSGGNDRVVRLWDLKTGRERSAWEGHTGSVQTLSFSADGRLALSGGSDRTVRVWEVASGRTLLRLEGHTDSVVAAAFVGTTGQIVSAMRSTEDGGRTVKVWDSAGKELAVGTVGRVELLAFSPEGRLALVAGGGDARVVSRGP